VRLGIYGTWSFKGEIIKVAHQSVQQHVDMEKKINPWQLFKTHIFGLSEFMRARPKFTRLHLLNQMRLNTSLGKSSQIFKADTFNNRLELSEQYYRAIIGKLIKTSKYLCPTTNFARPFLDLVRHLWWPTDLEKSMRSDVGVIRGVFTLMMCYWAGPKVYTSC